MNVKVILVNLGELVLNVLTYHCIIKLIRKIYQQYFNRSSIILMLTGKCNYSFYTVILIQGQLQGGGIKSLQNLKMQ